MQKETPARVISLYFLAKAAFSMVGIALFSMHVPWPSVLSFLFGDFAIYRTSVFFVVIFIVFYLMIFLGFANKSPLARVGAIPLLVVDLFVFPIGTIVALAIIIYLLSPYASAYFERFVPRNLPFRALGMAVIAASLIAFLVTTGLLTGLGEAVGGYPVSAVSASFKTLSVEEETGTVDVIVELTGSTTQAVSQQNVIIQTIQTLGGQVTGRIFRVSNAVRVSIDVSQLQVLAANPNVKRIEPVEIYVTPVGWNDRPILPQLENSNTILDVDKLWDMGYTGEGIVVAVVDTGINEDMEWLQRDGSSVVIDSYEIYADWVHWHGSSTASCVASQHPEYLGMAPDADLLDIEVFQTTAEGIGASNWDILDGWEWVANWKAQTGRFVICTNSFGAPAWSTGCGGWHYPCMLCQAANNMVTVHDIPMVVAAGNHYPWEDPRVMCPGQAEYVLTVGATDDDDVLAAFSNIGPTVDNKPKPDVVAPGVNINTFDEDGDMITVSGTSFSAPLTAGVMACIAQASPGYSAVQYEDAVRHGAKDLGSSGFDYSHGYGLVDGDDALNILGSEIPQGSYAYLVGILPFAGIGIATYPEWGGKKRGVFR